MAFDLSAALQGRSYPTAQVKAYLDEETAYLIYTEKKRIALLSGEELESAQAGLDKLIDRLDEQAYTFHLKGRSRIVVREIAKKALKEYPTPAGVLESDVSAADRQEFHDNLMWQAYIEKIVSPDGEELLEPSLEQVTQFRELAPTHAVIAISDKITELTDKGIQFDMEKQSVDFS